jgi:hypothetical protein
MTDNELKDECMENAEIDLRRYSNTELTQIREAMRIYADRKLKLFAMPDVSESVCLLNRKFYECEVHRCSTYGCLNCGQYKQTVC